MFGCQLGYVLAAVASIAGLWRAERWTWIAVSLFGLASLGAAVGGPLVFAPGRMLSQRGIWAAGGLVLVLCALTAWYGWRRSGARPRSSSL